MGGIPSTAIAQSVPTRYPTIDRALPISSAAKNPYDPLQADVQVTLTAPSGKTVTIPGFFAQLYRNTCTPNCSVETLQPDGVAGWRFRYTPDEPGTWRYTARITDSAGVRQTDPESVEVANSVIPGMIRVGTNKRYFVRENGTPYFPVGSNLGWSWAGGGGTLGYVRWLAELKRVGANYGRLYIDVSWFINLEAKPPLGDYTLGQMDAWKLDTILTEAEKSGIALQIVLIWSQGLSTYSYPPLAIPSTPLRPDTRNEWNTHPYNSALGGPVNNAAAFFNNETARNLFKRKLRYVAARWSYSPSIFAWEVIDQLDRPGANPGVASEWLKEMTGYLRNSDPSKHLVTAGVRDPARSILLVPAGLDFSATRLVARRPVETAPEPVAATLTTIKTLLPLAVSEPRPVMLTEFSLNPWFEPVADDPTGIQVIQSMWASVFGGAAGAGASLWWDTYLFPQKIIDQFAPLAAYTQGIPWGTRNFNSVGATLQSADPANYRPYVINGFRPELITKKSPDLTYRVTPDGLDPLLENVSGYLHPPKSSLNQPLKLIVAPPVETTLTITVKRSGERGGRLRALIDGKVIAELALPPRIESPALIIPITAGQHTLTLDNTGDDSVLIDSIQIGAYLPPLRALGLADPTGIYLGWFVHREYTWENANRKPPVQPKAVTFTAEIPGMSAGMYRVEFWELSSGNIAGEEQITVGADGFLRIPLLPVSSMFAVRAFRE
jgi:hypothetical protein